MMESILASIHHEIALVNELSGQDDLQIKEDFLTALEHALNIMKKSSDIITDVQKSSVQSVEEENTSADPQQDSNHSIHLLLQQKTLQMDLLQLEVNGLKANLILTQYLVKVIERKHEILVRRRERIQLQQLHERAKKASPLGG